MKSFESEISGSLSASEVEGSASFSTKLKSASEKHSVTVEVQCTYRVNAVYSSSNDHTIDSVVGDAGNTQYDKGDVIKTFNSFREVAKPVPYEVLLRHYNTIDHSVPLTINMAPEVYDRVTKVFTLARFVLFLIGVVPGTRGVRLKRREQITRLFSEIHSKRTQYEKNPGALKSSLDELKTLYETLWLRLQRQDLVMEVHSLTYDDMKK